GRSIGRFLRARFARVYPLHLVSFALVFLLFDEAHRTKVGLPTLGTAIANLTLVHAWIPSDRFYYSYDGPSWSVSTEATFYLLFPVLVWRWRRTWPAKLAAAAVLAALCIGVADWLNDFPSLVIVYINPLARLLEFSVGIGVAMSLTNVRRW